MVFSSTSPPQVSEQDLSVLQSGFERQLAAAESKAAALAKERAALRRQAERVTELEAALKEREETVKQVGRAAGWP